MKEGKEARGENKGPWWVGKDEGSHPLAQRMKEIKGGSLA